ncbi:MAG: hypothetical protein LBS91_04650 [Clostridiales Family XIII bacterium]|jgi:hypothetical protein|nr:hypothetical protein [Clostridiales Family XIII bacterium]
MSDLLSEKKARIVVKKLMPFLPWQSSDVKDEYDAGEYVAAADGAIHDLGALRTDLADALLTDIEDLIDTIREENDAYAIRFLDRMETGLYQLKTRRELAQSGRTA